MDKKETTDEQKIGVVVVTHADYGKELIRAAEFILGPLDNCGSVGIDGGQEVEKTVQQLKDTVKKYDAGKGVMVLTDMFGGTPTNLSLSLLGSRKLEVVTGVNLPMLLKVLNSNNSNLSDIAAEAKDAGGRGIVVAGEVLRSKVKKD